MKLNLENLSSVEEKVRRYKWLKGIIDEYEQMIKLIESEGDHFRLCSFSYSARGDEQKFEVNPHRTIPFTFIRDGLKEALARISEEMEQIEKELQ